MRAHARLVYSKRLRFAPGLECSSPWDVLLSCSSLYPPPRPSFSSFFFSRLPASTKWIIRDIRLISRPRGATRINFRTSRKLVQVHRISLFRFVRAWQSETPWRGWYWIFHELLSSYSVKGWRLFVVISGTPIQTFNSLDRNEHVHLL